MSDKRRVAVERGKRVVPARRRRVGRGFTTSVVLGKRDSLLTKSQARKAMQWAEDKNLSAWTGAHPWVIKSGNTRWPTQELLIHRLDRLGRLLGRRVKIISGYRSNEEQNVLYQRYLSYRRGVGPWAPLAAPPGRSNHNRGTAADCGIIDHDGSYTSLGNYPRVRALLPKVRLHLPVPGEAWHAETR